MTYKVLELAADGTGVAAIVLDDGTAFNQNFIGCGAQTVEDLDAFMLGLAQEYSARHPVGAGGRVSATVQNVVGTERSVVE